MEKKIGIVQLDKNGGIAKELKPRHTSIVQFERVYIFIPSISDKNICRYIVREDYYKYPKGQSNLYVLSESLEEVYDVELPFENDIYANSFKHTTERGDLECCTWDGWICKITLFDGKIVSKVHTK